MAAERKIRRNLQKQLQVREDEIEALKEQQNILAKLAVATKTAQRPNPTAAASSMPNSLAAQEQERKNIIEGLVRGVINPGINLGGKMNA